MDKGPTRPSHIPAPLDYMDDDEVHRYSVPTIQSEGIFQCDKCSRQDTKHSVRKDIPVQYMQSVGYSNPK
jgi:hypothetical protein